MIGGEQPLIPYGSCNLAALDLSKFFRKGEFDWKLFEKGIRYGVKFLDSIIDVNQFPTPEIEENVMGFRQIGLGLMGLADYYLVREIPYGSDEALGALDEIGEFLYKISYDESERLGREKGVPEHCKNLPTPRRNITVLTIAPTGTTSIIAGCNNGIEPFFSEITQRKDKTGEYTLNLEGSEKEYFKCAVPMDGDKSREVTWKEHVDTQAVIQKWIDSGVSKTCNVPQMTPKETVGNIFMYAWKADCKGITVYRNGSRKEEVLTPKNISKNLCPSCESDTRKEDGCLKCMSCEWSLCSI